MKLVLSSLLTFAFLSFGCSKIENSLSSADQSVTNTEAKPAASVYSGESKAQQGQQQGQGAAMAANAAIAQVKFDETQAPLASAPAERKVIQNGEFSIETKTPTEDQRKIAAIASTLSGFVVTSEFQQSSSSTSTVSIIVRVPSANFQKATEEIRKVGLQVLHEKLTGQDVTAEYIDLEARLRAKKALQSVALISSPFQRSSRAPAKND